MITLNQIRELVLKQDREFESILFDYVKHTKLKNSKNKNEMHEKKELKKQIEEKLIEKKIEDAKELFKQYKKIANDDINVYSIEGILEINENNLDKAFEVFQEGLTKQPTNTDLLYNLGYLGTLIGDIDSSIYYYSQCLKYADDINLIEEIELILKRLSDCAKDDIMTIITVGLRKEENYLFLGSNNVVGIIENDTLEYENKYEEDGITVCEVNSKKTLEIM